MRCDAMPWLECEFQGMYQRMHRNLLVLLPMRDYSTTRVVPNKWPTTYAHTSGLDAVQRQPNRGETPLSWVLSRSHSKDHMLVPADAVSIINGQTSERV